MAEKLTMKEMIRRAMDEPDPGFWDGMRVHGDLGSGLTPEQMEAISEEMVREGLVSKYDDVLERAWKAVSDLEEADPLRPKT